MKILRKNKHSPYIYNNIIRSQRKKKIQYVRRNTYGMSFLSYKNARHVVRKLKGAFDNKSCHLRFPCCLRIRVPFEFWIISLYKVKLPSKHYPRLTWKPSFRNLNFLHQLKHMHLLKKFFLEFPVKNPVQIFIRNRKLMLLFW